MAVVVTKLRIRRVSSRARTEFWDCSEGTTQTVDQLPPVHSVCQAASLRSVEGMSLLLHN